jgi:uncharacterized protein (TIGR02757 family)
MNHQKLKQIKALLDQEVQLRNSSVELSYEKPDPLMIATRHQDEVIALICALFGYGNARQIVKFLDTLDFGLLDQSEDQIRQALQAHYYRFQKSEDVIALFVALGRLKRTERIEDIVYEGYRKEGNVLDGLWLLITKLQNYGSHDSDGYRFLIGSLPRQPSKAGTYKRYMMYLRWMVRHDSLDMGLWKKIDKADLIMPLDTHTFHISRNMGLLERKSCDMKAALELTRRFREFDQADPVKYDFALYRIGQERVIRHKKDENSLKV